MTLQEDRAWYCPTSMINYFVSESSDEALSWNYCWFITLNKNTNGPKLTAPATHFYNKCLFSDAQVQHIWKSSTLYKPPRADQTNKDLICKIFVIMEKGADKSFEFKMITKFAIVVVFFLSNILWNFILLIVNTVFIYIIFTQISLKQFDTQSTSNMKFGSVDLHYTIWIS